MYISSALLHATENGNKTRSATATNSVNTILSTIPFPIPLADGIFQSSTYFIQSIKLFLTGAPTPFPHHVHGTLSFSLSFHSGL